MRDSGSKTGAPAGKPALPAGLSWRRTPLLTLRWKIAEAQFERHSRQAERADARAEAALKEMEEIAALIRELNRNQTGEDQ